MQLSAGRVRLRVDIENGEKGWVWWLEDDEEAVVGIQR